MFFGLRVGLGDKVVRMVSGKVFWDMVGLGL